MLNICMQYVSFGNFIAATILFVDGIWQLLVILLESGRAAVKSIKLPCLENAPTVQSGDVQTVYENLILYRLYFDTLSKIFRSPSTDFYFSAMLPVVMKARFTWNATLGG